MSKTKEKLDNLEKSYQEIQARVQRDLASLEQLKGAYAVLSEILKEEEQQGCELSSSVTQSATEDLNSQVSL